MSDDALGGWSVSTEGLIGAWNPTRTGRQWPDSLRPESSQVGDEPAEERDPVAAWVPESVPPSAAADFTIGGGPSGDDGLDEPPRGQTRNAHSLWAEHQAAIARRQEFPRPGEDLAGFRLIGELGRGAFARVYLAEQIALAGRPVALKVAPALGDEPQSLARLQHAHIVPIHSVHDDPASGLRLMCMPYLGGANLARVLEASGTRLPSQATGESLVEALDFVAAREIAASRHRSSIARARSDRVGSRQADRSVTPAATEVSEAQPARSYLRSHTYIQASVWIVARLAEALEHAHAHRLLHRDLKPSNILVAADGTPMLLDFNLSASLDDDGEAASRARLGGTLPYMAPEHLDAFDPEGTTPADAVDERSDLYSLGLILFEMIAGQHPFDDPDPNRPLHDALHDMIDERRRGAPSPRALNPLVPPSLDAIVRTCLAPDPSDRYQNAHDLADDLRRFLDDLPLAHIPEPSLRERAAKWLRRHPEARGSTTVGTVAALLLLGLGLIAWLVAGRLEAASAVLKFQRFESDFRECQVLLNTASGPVAHLGRGLDLARRALLGYGVDQPRRWAERPDVRHLAPGDRGALAENLAELVLLRARAEVDRVAHKPEPVRRRALESALDWLDHAEAIDPHPSAALHLDRARYLRALGLAHRARLEQARADALTPRTARDYYLLGAVMAAEDRLDAAERHLSRAVALDGRRFWAWFALGLCHLDQGRNAEAAADFATCTILAPTFAWPHLNRGLALARAGRLVEAMASYDRAIAFNPNFVEARINRALCRLELDDAEGAADDLDRARRLGRNDPPVLAARAEALARLGRRDEAAHEFDAAIAASPESPTLLVARGFFRLGHDPEAARADFEAALAIQPAEARALLGLAHLTRAGDPREALILADRALASAPGLADALQLRALLRAHLADPAAVADADALARTPTASNLYNAACALSVLARTTHDDRLIPRALDLLARAVEAGFPPEHAADDPDFADLRGLPEFRRVLSSSDRRVAHSR